MEKDLAQKQRDHKKRQKKRRKDEHLQACAEIIVRCEHVIDRFPKELLWGSKDSFAWDDMPPALSPLHNLEGDRAIKKKQQCESFARALAPLIARYGTNNRRLVVIDFGSGSGNASLPCAWWFRDSVSFVLMDRFDEPIRIARERVSTTNLDVKCFVSYIREFEPCIQFDIGFSSHACGRATDDALSACIAAGASFCLTSCCVGKLQQVEEHDQLPRSKVLQSLVSRDEFLQISKAGEHDTNHSWDENKAKCKLLLEVDRLQLALEAGYEVHRTKLEPLTCSPKNDCIYGFKRGN